MDHHSGIEREHGFFGFRGMRGSKELLRSLRGLTHLVTSQGTNTIVGGPKRPPCASWRIEVWSGVECRVDECGVKWSETQWSETPWSGEWSGEWGVERDHPEGVLISYMISCDFLFRVGVMTPPGDLHRMQKEGTPLFPQAGHIVIQTPWVAGRRMKGVLNPRPHPGRRSPV